MNRRERRLLLALGLIYVACAIVLGLGLHYLLS